MNTLSAREIAPQVVFEILSPGNRAEEMRKKFLFYNRPLSKVNTDIREKI